MKNIDQYDLDKLNREYSPSSCIDDINIYIQQYISLRHKAKDLADIENTLP